MEAKVTLPSDKVAAGIDEGLRRIGASEQEAYHTPGLFHVESNFRSGAQNKRGSAGGLGQFTDSTWKATIKSLRKEHGDEMADFVKSRGKFDPAAGTIAAVHHHRKNAARLEKAGLDADDPVGAYAVHFAGRHGIKLMKALEEDPDTPLSEVLSKKQQRANPGIMKLGTVGRFADHFRTKIVAGAEAYAGRDASRAIAELEKDGRSPDTGQSRQSPHRTSDARLGSDIPAEERPSTKIMAQLIEEAGLSRMKPLESSSVMRGDHVSPMAGLPAGGRRQAASLTV